jgi:hypothetical protein
MAIHKSLTAGLSLAERLKVASVDDLATGCRLWIGSMAGGNGYGRLRWQDRPIQRAHRLAWEAAYGSVPEGMSVLHKCDVRRCVNPKHLFLGTNGDNNTDRSQKGRNAIVVGAQRYNAKLTDEVVRAIKSSQETQLALAHRHGVSASVISRIKSGKIWKHVKTSAKG